jgi:hypothetical protein
MGMVGPGINAQIAELHATEWPARQHALDSLLYDALGEFALKN